VNPFEAMDESQLRELLERLTYHAYCKLVRLRWRGLTLREGGSVPGGAEARDLAAQAIVDVIDGTRAWDPAAHPDLFRYLKDVIDSKVSNLVSSAENRTARRFPDPGADPAGPAEDRLQAPEPGPFEVAADREGLRVFRAAVVAALGTDTLVLRIFECLEADVTRPSEIAERLGLPVRTINNAQKRLQRKVNKVLRKLRGDPGP
jgi:DNA-directed RNA polymerase specialized sigma24 family protein